jgi:hypothetical protein
MLSLETMGVLALAILWVNTLLVAGATWGPLLDRVRRLRAARHLVVGEVAAGEADGALASHLVDQVGRRAGDRTDDAILFHDRAARSVVHGGRVRAGGRALEIPAGAAAEVWVERAAEPPPTDAIFAEAFAAARTARGYARSVAAPIQNGAPVWIVGKIEGRHVAAVPGAPLVIAGFDPRPWLRRAIALLVLLALGSVAAAAAVTALALTPPLFGTVSTVGGAVGLAFFLLVQPLGVAVQERTLVPSAAPLRGQWSRAAEAAAHGNGRSAQHLTPVE